jgi:hypothetical protein
MNMAKTGIEDLLADQATKRVLTILRDAINGALGSGKPGRKRGRPRKAKAAVSENGAEPKRKRGRPKKEVVAEPAAEQGSRGEHERVAAHRGQEVVAQL